MAKKLYIANLPYSTTDDALQVVFSKVGPVMSVKIIKDHATGRSRGFGFVEMSREEDAMEAINTLNGVPYDGRTLTVCEARPPQHAMRTATSGFAVNQL